MYVRCCPEEFDIINFISISPEQDGTLCKNDKIFSLLAEVVS